MNTGYLIFSPSKPYSAYAFNVIQNIIVAHIFSPSEPYSAYAFNVIQNIIVAHRVKVQINQLPWVQIKVNFSTKGRIQECSVDV